MAGLCAESSGWTSSELGKYPKIREYECLASVFEAYPTAMGHFTHEVLPSNVCLFEHIPNTCPILAALSPFVQRYIALLPMHLHSRIVKLKDPGHVYYSTNLYIANEEPYCHLQNPHNGGMFTFSQPPLLQRVRAVLSKIIQVLKPTRTQIFY